MSNRLPFQASRDDGRSDAQVVIDLVWQAQPDTKFDYPELESALSSGLADPTVITRARVGAAARRANMRLLREHKRELSVVRGFGYRIVKAAEQRNLAVVRETSAERQLRRALVTLNFTRLDEMDEPNRIAHLAHLQISGAIWSVTQRLAKQQSRHDAAIKKLTQRMDDMQSAGEAG